jgi:hypothetical protein
MDLSAAAQRLLSRTVFGEGLSIGESLEWLIAFSGERRRIECGY